jgi:tetratricopeptide (TPR) repeat protein
MRAPPSHPPAPDRLIEVGELYEAHRIRDAWDHLAPEGLAALRTPQDLNWGRRLLSDLGCLRAARWCTVRVLRSAPENLRAAIDNARFQADRHPLRGLAALDTLGMPQEGDPVDLAEVHLLRAELLTSLRDFSAAEPHLRAAAELTPGRTEHQLARSAWLMARDRRKMALALVELVREREPLNRWAIAQQLQLLVGSSREEEALALLHGLPSDLQLPAHWVRRAHLEEGLGRFDDAWASLERALTLVPWFEQAGFSWFAARRAELAAKRGDWKLAVDLARLSGSPSHGAWAARAEAQASAPASRVLRVPHVQQLHQGCAPAAMAAISAYWQQPIDQDDLAREITWNGTHVVSELQWLTSHGWSFREFRASKESISTLLSRGVPVLLSTAWVRSGHEQVIIGEDVRRGIFIVRDPSSPSLVELDAEEVLREHAWNGPRALVFVPTSRASLIAELPLPDADLYALNQALDLALHEQRIGDASEACTRLEALAPDHQLTLSARLKLAEQTQNSEAVAQCLDALRARYPRVPRYGLRLAELRGIQGHPQKRVEVLRETVAATGHPSALIELSRALVEDARALPEGIALLRRAEQATGPAPELFLAWASVRQKQGRFEEALRLLRFAACLDDRNEEPVLAYALEANRMGRVEEALPLLEERTRDAEGRTAGPAQTLLVALDEAGMQDRAQATLERALAVFPEDTSLNLLAIRLFVRWNRVEQAASALERARPTAGPPAWLSASAVVEEARGELAAARDRWMEALGHTPHWDRALHEAVRLHTLLEGAEKTLEWISEQQKTGVGAWTLSTLRIQLARSLGAERWREAVEAHLATFPDDAWAVREAAKSLLECGRLDEALAAAQRAIDLAPANAVAHVLCGQLLLKLRRREEALKALREALRLDVGTPPALNLFLSALRTPEEWTGAAAFIEPLLELAVDPGPALLTLIDARRTPWSDAQLLALCDKLAASKPFSWDALAATIRLLNSLGNKDAALTRVIAACEGPFAEVSAAWMLRSSILEELGAEAHWLEALEHLETHWPRDARVLRFLAGTYEARSEPAAERRVMGRLLAIEPRSSEAWYQLGALERSAGALEQAWPLLQRAIEIDPGAAEAWDALLEVATELERLDALEPLAQEAASHSQSAAPLIILERILASDPTRLDEQEACIAEIIRREPENWRGYDARALWFIGQSRLEEAREACLPATFGNPPPELRFRAAAIDWNLGERSQAIEALQSLVRAVPTYTLAHEALVRWLSDVPRPEAAIAAARDWVTAAPSARAHLALGRTLWKNDDFEAAIQAYREGVACAPGEAAPVFILLEALFVVRRAGEAKELLAHLKPVLPEGIWATFSVLVALEQGRPSEAAAHLEYALRFPLNDTGPLEAAIEAMEVNGESGRLRRAFFRAMKSGHPDPFVAEIWAKHVSDDWRLITWSRVNRLPEPARQHARVYLLQRWSHSHAPWFLRFLPIFQRGALQTSDHVWVYVGTALLNNGLVAAARRWYRDWRERAGLGRWMFVNVISAFVWADPAVAREALGRALSLPGTDAQETLLSWAMWFHAVDGNADAYQSLLTAAGPGADGFPRMVRAFAHAVALGQGLVEPSPGLDRDSEIEQLFEEAWEIRQEAPRSLHYLNLQEQARSRIRQLAA